MIRRFWPAVRPYRGRLAIVLVLAMIGPLLDTLSISLYGRLVDEVLVPRQLAMLGPIAAAYVGLTVVGGLLGFGRSYLSAWITEHLLFDLRTGSSPICRRCRWSSSSARASATPSPGSRKTSTSSASSWPTVSPTACPICSRSSSSSGRSSISMPAWRVISLVVAPPFWFIGRRFATRVKALAREQRARDGAVTAIVEESLGNAPLVQAYNGQAAAAAGFAQETRTVMATQLALERLRAGYAPLVSLIEVGGMLIVIGVGAIDLAARPHHPRRVARLSRLPEPALWPGTRSQPPLG